jgi:hypothetical protein
MTNNMPYTTTIRLDNSEQLGKVVAALIAELNDIGHGHRFEIWMDMLTLSLHDNGAVCVGRILHEINTNTD